MTTVLEDIVSDSLDPEYGLQRVEDWEYRLTELYSTIRSWLPDSWQATEGEPIVMHEKLMQKAGIKQRKIPTLKVFNQVGHEILFVPKGLWIVCANGRVDLKYKCERYFIYDSAKIFEQPDWKVVNPMYWERREPLNEEWMAHLLS